MNAHLNQLTALKSRHIHYIKHITTVRYLTAIMTMLLGYVANAAAQVKTTDSTFVKQSHPIEFVVNRINISAQDREWITHTLIPKLQALGDNGIVLGRATASPEGPTPNNYRLAKERRASVDALLGSYGISTRRIRYDVVAEDYPLLRTLMQLSHDTQLPVVDSLIQRYESKPELLKKAMKQYKGGKLWTYLLRIYFPKLRAVRIMAIDQRLVRTDIFASPLPTLNATFPLKADLPEATLQEQLYTPRPIDEPRQELLSIKTNLLFDLAYMPGYNRFCPVPNIAVEYYPISGHFTYGGSFDGPWWQHYQKHKYFQLRNYQLHTRYYLHADDIQRHRPGKGAAFKGLFFSAYAHAYLYNICFGEKRGWEGEGWGAGLGIGYVVPLGGKEHWRLEFGLQAGYLNTKYDPYQWRCPVDPDADPEQYYYKWYGDSKDFRKRQHRYTWQGPTRLEITLSYDILYRQNHKRGLSFRNHERATR